MKLACNLDALVDLDAANREAYRRIGIEVPVGCDGRPWMEWLPAAVTNLDLPPVEIVRLKNDLLCGLISEFAQARPLLRVITAKNKHVTVLAPYSLDVADTLKMWFCARRIHVVPRLAREGKVEWLAHNGVGIYVEDDEVTAFWVRELTMWTVWTTDEASLKL